MRPRQSRPSQSRLPRLRPFPAVGPLNPRYRHV